MQEDSGIFKHYKAQSGQRLSQWVVANARVLQSIRFPALKRPPRSYTLKWQDTQSTVTQYKRSHKYCSSTCLIKSENDSIKKKNTSHSHPDLIFYLMQLHVSLTREVSREQLFSQTWNQNQIQKYHVNIVNLWRKFSFGKKGLTLWNCSFPQLFPLILCWAAFSNVYTQITLGEIMCEMYFFSRYWQRATQVR